MARLLRDDRAFPLVPASDPLKAWHRFTTAAVPPTHLSIVFPLSVSRCLKETEAHFPKP